MLINGEVETIEGDNLCATITSKELALEVEHNQANEELYNFKMIAALKKDQAPFEFDPYSNLKANVILKRWGCFLGLAIGQRAQGWTSFPLTQQENYKFRLGYQPNRERSS